MKSNSYKLRALNSISVNTDIKISDILFVPIRKLSEFYTNFKELLKTK